MASTFARLLRTEIGEMLPYAKVETTHNAIKQSMIVTVRVGDRQVKKAITHLEILRADGGMGWYSLAREIAQEMTGWLRQP
jgi:hypothetical protein